MREPSVADVAKAVQAGVQWLREYSGQLSEARSIAIAISALVAAERNPHSSLVQRLQRELTSQQQSNGSWNDELWDTTWAVRALLDVGTTTTSPSIQRALRFLKATQDPIDRTWYEEPFETILAARLLFELDPEAAPSLTVDAINWLASLQNANGMVVGTRYTGMAVSFFVALGNRVASSRTIVERGVAFLRGSMREGGSWTSAAWSNFYSTQALLDAGYTLDDPTVAAAVSWFLGSQETNGRWMQVSQVHDTATAVLLLSRLLTAPLIDVTTPELAVLHVSRENGTLRVGFVPPGVGAVVPSERMKLSDSVRRDLASNQRKILAAISRTTRSAASSTLPVPRSSEALGPDDELLQTVGEYTFGHLIPPRIQALLEQSDADHLRFELDERLIDLPWELIHDGNDFLCLRYASGRSVISDQPLPIASHRRRMPCDAKALVVADPTGDLPAAKIEGMRVAQLLQEGGVNVTLRIGAEVTKRDLLLGLREHDVIHYAGHADFDSDNPDESCLVMHDGPIQAFEIGRFMRDRSPSVVFLNACWSAEEARDPEALSPMTRGLGRTFLFAGVTAFVGYLVPVPDDAATRFALKFYSCLSIGHSIGESVRRSRISVREAYRHDLTWASAILYGEPSAAVFAPS